LGHKAERGRRLVCLVGPDHFWRGSLKQVSSEEQKLSSIGQGGDGWRATLEKV
jgi:hypothetical protein